MEPTLTTSGIVPQDSNPIAAKRPPRNSRLTLAIVIALVGFAVIFSFYLYGMVLSLEEEARAAKESRAMVDRTMRFPNQ